MKLLLLALSVLTLATVAAASAPSLPVASVAAVSALSHADAARHLPAAFQATVTYFRGREHTLFVQDGQSAIYIGATTSLQLLPGDRIFVRGLTGDSFRPVVDSSDITLLHHGSPPAPVPASFSPMIRAELDCRYVTVRGTVRSANLTLSSSIPVTSMEIVTDGGSVAVTMDNSDPAVLKGLIDSEVDITGAAAGRFDGKMQQVGLLLHVTSFNQVKILHPATHDAWSVPVTPMDEVLGAFHVVDLSQLVRVQGTLTYYYPSSFAVLQDGPRSIRVLTPEINPLPLGSRVDAIGIPFVDNGFLTLKLGHFRVISPAPAIPPHSGNWHDLAGGKNAFDLVSIEGTVVSQVRQHLQDVYIVSADGRLFSATLRHPFPYDWIHPPPIPPMPKIPPGSKVRVTGVAILDHGDPFNGAMDFGILLRSASDVAVLAPPSPLNVRNLILAVNILLAIIAIVALWVAILRRKVSRQSAALTARIEAEALLERRRSQILEDINGSRPLPEILAQIAQLVTSKLNGAHCWLQVGLDPPLGNCPPDTAALRVLQQEIRSHAGGLHGTLFAAIDALAASAPNETQALSLGAGLATLAIETRSLYSDLVHRSEFDLLTDIHNRFSLEKRLDSLIYSARTKDDPSLDNFLFGLIYIDLDDFKLVNDRFGHRVGDLYLNTIAQRMKRILRPGDMLARIGGDEFAAVITHIRTRAEIEDIALRLDRCFLEPLSLDGYTLSGTASIGIALYPKDGRTKDALFTAADVAMYSVKNTRRHADSPLASQPPDYVL